MALALALSLTWRLRYSLRMYLNLSIICFSVFCRLDTPGLFLRISQQKRPDRSISPAAFSRIRVSGPLQSARCPGVPWNRGATAGAAAMASQGWRLARSPTSELMRSPTAGAEDSATSGANQAPGRSHLSRSRIRCPPPTAPAWSAGGPGTRSLRSSCSSRTCRVRRSNGAQSSPRAPWTPLPLCNRQSYDHGCALITR